MDKKSFKKFKQKNIKTTLDKIKPEIISFKTIIKTIYKKKKRNKKQTQALKGSNQPCLKELEKNTYFIKIHKIWYTKHKTEKKTTTDKLRCK